MDTKTVGEGEHILVADPFVLDKKCSALILRDLA